MADDEPLGMRKLRLQVARKDARGRGADHRVRRGGGLDLGIDRLLDVKPLRHRLDDQLGIGDRLGDAGGKPHLPAFGKRRHGQPGNGMVGIRHHVADLARRFRIGIEDSDIDTVLDKPGHPAAADHAAADNGGAAGFHRSRHLCLRSAQRATGARLVSPSRSRTASGPTMLAPMFSTTVTARSTSCALVAKTPRER